MNNCIQVIKVGIADVKLVRAPELIRTSGLGSCVGVVIYDLARQIAGLAHIMLPSSSLAKQDEFNPAKYADTALVHLVSLLKVEGANQHTLKAKMAGGAQMFQFTSMSDMMRIGPRNIEAVRNELKQLKIPVLSEDVGGNSGRTIEFDPKNGMLQIRTVNKGTHEI